MRHARTAVLATLIALVLTTLWGCGGGGGGTGGTGSATVGSGSTPQSLGSPAVWAGSAGSGSSTGDGGSTATANPFVGAKLFVDPNSDAAQQVAAWSTSQPQNAAEIEKIATQPQAFWVDGGDATIAPGSVQYLNQMQQQGFTALIVIYNIYDLNNTEPAAGGSTTPANYQTYIQSVAATLGSQKAIVVLEPDALASLSSLSSADQQTRLSLISGAIQVLKAQPNTSVYVDAGNPLWIPASDMATTLTQAGIAQADGFAINVSNFAFTSDNLTYGQQISAAVGGKHFVVDTSRNGLGPAPNDYPFNPPGRALGPRFTTQTGSALCDAFVFIKNPGSSDGPYNGGPAWGWWPAYALGLCQNAAY